MKFKRGRLAPAIRALRSSALLQRSYWVHNSRRLGTTLSTTSGHLMSKARDLKLDQKLDDALARVREIQTTYAKVSLSYTETERNADRVTRMTSLHGTYIPTAYLLHPLMHNIFQANFHDLPDIKYNRELFALPDGGTVSLDWLAPPAATDETDIAIIIHGLAGGSETPYIRALSDAGAEKGFRTAVFHNRGLGYTKLTTPFPYNGADLTDFETVLERLHARYPKARIFGVGTSLGGNILMRYLIKNGGNSLISGGVSLAAPFDIRETVRFIEGNVYEHFLVKKLKSSILAPNLAMLRQLERSHGIKVDEIMKVNTFAQFYGMLHIKLLGYDCPYKYVATSNIEPSTVANIKKPLLILHSRDDPIVPVKQVPKDVIKANPNLIYAETAFGAHHAWLEGVLRPRRWYPKPTFQFLEILAQEQKQAEPAQSLA